MARKYQLHGAFPSKAGESAYEVALKNGFEGTEQEWLASLVGPPGSPGSPGIGESAYEVAKKNGFEGTEEDWLNSLIGPQGPMGPEGATGATFQFELTLEEDVENVSIDFPVNWEKILQFNIHMKANIPTEMEVTSFTGGASWAGIGTLPAGSIGLNIYGITFDLDSHSTIICTEVSIKNRSDSALPKFPTKGRLAYKTGNTFALYSATEGAMFPAGTKFYVWGVYAP